MSESELIKIYGPILERLCERLEKKHDQYGTSYLLREYEWLRERLAGELKELDGELFSVHLSGDGTIKECLDVAICALLIADKKRKEEEDIKEEVVTTFEDPTPF